MERYAALDESFPKKLLDELRREADHRRSMDRQAADRIDQITVSQTRVSERGQVLAAAIALVVILGGIGLIAAGRGTEGLASVLATLGTLVTAFLGARVISYFEERAETSSDESDAE